jgi:hypothetical protein
MCTLEVHYFYERGGVQGNNMGVTQRSKSIESLKYRGSF